MKAFLLFLLPCLLAGCSAFSDAEWAEYDASIELIEAEASLHRLADEQNDPIGPDYFVLRTVCVLKVTNNSGRTQMVVSEFGSAYDDLRLRIRDEKGQRLSTTAHALLMEPTLEKEWHRLDKGETYVQLTAATPVGPAPLDRQLPFITEKALTQTIQLEYFGGFPGSDLHAVQSNRLTVKIQDRTAEEPRQPGIEPADKV